MESAPMRGRLTVVDLGQLGDLRYCIAFPGAFQGE